MGGIPWQSKGCRTCRKRKIKCDQQEPECARCRKTGIKCLGYDRDRFFVHQVTTGKSKKSTNTGTTAGGGGSGGGGGAPKGAGKLQVAKRPPLQPQQPWIMPQAVAAGPAMRGQVFSEFTNIYFPQSIDTSYALDVWHYLISGFSTLPKKTEMLDKAIAALACFYLGKQRKDDRLFHHGIQLYNSAIRHLSIMMSQNNYCDDIVYTTIVFQEIESCYCPHGLHIWVAHIAGTNAILRHFRRRAGKNPLIDAIYNQHQKLRILFSTTGRGMSPEDYEYLTKPCDDRPVNGLMKFYGEASPIVDAINSVDASDYQACQAVLAKCIAHKDALLAWYTAHKKDFGGGPSECEPGTTLNPRLSPTDDLFGVSYRFSSLDNAKLHIVFWVALSISHRMIYEARGLVLSHSNALDIPTDRTQDVDLLLSMFYHDEIGRSVPYCVQDSMKSWGFSSLLWGLSQLLNPYAEAGNWEKFVWCQKALLLGSERGYESAVRLSEIFWAVWHRVNPREKRFMGLSLGDFDPQYKDTQEQHYMKLVDRTVEPVVLDTPPEESL
ncbi:hypothetical protein PMG11_09979 [Penicillium brasilianum]|uniref:Zn(2)-C6 fungal-type domain-containing protein n=1 Tax=Penicillium brasilianum TaxID=104259 RepID=A0A0F7U1E5_PENBI|nr:hypothetical protein PMG11_09979 [Penicillium brasilianum]